MKYRLLFYLTGMTITYLGTTLVVKSSIGAGFWSALYVGLGQSIGLTVGFWFAMFQMMIVFLNAYLQRRQPVWLAFVPIILESALFDFWLEIVFKNVLFPDHLPIKVSLFFLGLIIASFGIGLYIQTGLTRSPIDELFLAVSERFGCRISLSQTIIALTVMTAAFIVGGPVGLGTVLSVFAIGPLIEFWNGRLNAHFYKRQLY